MVEKWKQIASFGNEAVALTRVTLEDGSQCLVGKFSFSFTVAGSLESLGGQFLWSFQ
jgi:hypothetical protein